MLLGQGCVSLPQLPDSGATFALKGKVAISEGDERFTASILWQQQGGDFEIDLWGPLGQGRVQLVKQNARMVLRNGQDEVLLEGDPEALMRDQLGWSLPVDVLPAWVQGQPLAGVGSRDLDYDDAGRLTAFEQLGWQVALARYQPVAGSTGDESVGRTLPTRVDARKGDSRLRLAIAEWKI